MTFRKRAERTLFFTLWGALILASALWAFWPTFKPVTDPPPLVELGQELRYWFASAIVTETVPSHYGLDLKLLADYRARLDKNQMPVELGFEYWGHTSPLYRGQTHCVIRPNLASVHVELPNPERI